MADRRYESLAPLVLFALVLLLGFLLIGGPFGSMFYPAIFLATLTLQIMANMSFKSLGLDFSSRWKKSTLIYYSIAMIMVSLHVVVAIMMGGLLVSSLSMFTLEAIALLIMAQVAQFGVGFFEEYTFRGYMLTAMETYGRKASVLVSSVSFASVHIFAILTYGYAIESVIVFIVNMFLGGVTLALIRLGTDSLIPAIAFHASWNFFGYHLFGLMESEIAFYDVTYLLPDILIGFELGLMTTAIFTTLILLLIFAHLRNRKRKVKKQEITV